MKLQEKFPEIELMTATQAIAKIGWDYDTTETGAENIRCCNEHVTIGGFFGAEYAYCIK